MEDRAGKMISDSDPADVAQREREIFKVSAYRNIPGIRGI